MIASRIVRGSRTASIPARYACTFFVVVLHGGSGCDGGGGANAEKGEPGTEGVVWDWGAFEYVDTEDAKDADVGDDDPTGDPGGAGPVA